MCGAELLVSSAAGASSGGRASRFWVVGAAALIAASAVTTALQFFVLDDAHAVDVPEWAIDQPARFFEESELARDELVDPNLGVVVAVGGSRAVVVGGGIEESVDVATGQVSRRGWRIGRFEEQAGRYVFAFDDAATPESIEWGTRVLEGVSGVEKQDGAFVLVERSYVGTEAAVTGSYPGEAWLDGPAGSATALFFDVGPSFVRVVREENYAWVVDHELALLVVFDGDGTPLPAGGIIRDDSHGQTVWVWADTRDDLRPWVVDAAVEVLAHTPGVGEAPSGEVAVSVLSRSGPPGGPVSRVSLSGTGTEVAGLRVDHCWFACEPGGLPAVAFQMIAIDRDHDATIDFDREGWQAVDSPGMLEPSLLKFNLLDELTDVACRVGVGVSTCRASKTAVETTEAFVDLVTWLFTEWECGAPGPGEGPLGGEVSESDPYLAVTRLNPEDPDSEIRSTGPSHWGPGFDGFFADEVRRVEIEDYRARVSLAQAWFPLIELSQDEPCGEIVRIGARVFPYSANGVPVETLAESEFVEIVYTIFYAEDGGRFAKGLFSKVPDVHHLLDNEGFSIGLQRTSSAFGRCASGFEFVGGLAVGHRDPKEDGGLKDYIVGRLEEVSEATHRTRSPIVPTSPCPGERDDSLALYVAENKHAAYHRSETGREYCELQLAPVDNLLDKLIPGLRLGTVYTESIETIDALMPGDVRFDLTGGMEECEPGRGLLDLSGWVEVYYPDLEGFAYDADFSDGYGLDGDELFTFDDKLRGKWCVAFDVPEGDPLRDLQPGCDDDYHPPGFFDDFRDTIAGSVSASDLDGDFYYEPMDCDDGDTSINPGAAEVYDGKDNDCDGQVDEGFRFTISRDGTITVDDTSPSDSGGSSSSSDGSGSGGGGPVETIQVSFAYWNSLTPRTIWETPSGSECPDPRYTWVLMWVTLTRDGQVVPAYADDLSSATISWSGGGFSGSQPMTWHNEPDLWFAEIGHWGLNAVEADTTLSLTVRGTTSSGATDTGSGTLTLKNCDTSGVEYGGGGG